MGRGGAGHEGVVCPGGHEQVGGITGEWEEAPKIPSWPSLLPRTSHRPMRWSLCLSNRKWKSSAQDSEWPTLLSALRAAPSQMLCRFSLDPKLDFAQEGATVQRH